MMEQRCESRQQDLISCGKTEVETTTYRILIVDDEEPILFAIKDYFDANGFEVHCARNSREAKSLLDKLHYFVVIADLRLSGIDDIEGLEITNYVRRQFPSTDVILLTAYGSPEIEKQARRQGVHTILHKPQPLPKLAQVVDSLIKSRDPQK
jgi:CheY-like chemotaxis protein